MMCTNLGSFAVLVAILACVLFGPLHACRLAPPLFRTNKRYPRTQFQIRHSVSKLSQTTSDVTLNTCDDDWRRCTKSVVPPTSSEVGHQDESYHTEKIALVGELARIYWERVVLFGLWGGCTGLEWTDLLVRDSQHFGDLQPSAKVKACLRLAKSNHPAMKPELITPVFHFIQEFGLPEPHIPLSVFEVPLLVGKAEDFKFKANDPHKKLVKKLGDVLCDNCNLGWLPSYSRAQKRLTDAHNRVAVPRAEKEINFEDY